MKTNLLKSIFISLILVMGVCNVYAETVTFTSDDILFFNKTAVSWWGNDEVGLFAYFFNNSTQEKAWSANAKSYSGNVYYVKIPAGSWEGVILTRNSVTSNPSWDNRHNQTGNISLSSTKNYISTFSENSDQVTWDTQKPTSSGGLAASSTSVNTGTNVTLTPSLTSNTDYNEIKSTSYSISPNSGASINDNTFTATAEGTYTITATITYNPRGYASLTSTTTATTTITVKSLKPTTIYLKPNSNWKQASARFAIYCWNSSGDKWFDMTKIDCDGDYYTVEIPGEYSDFKFVRMNPATTDNNFNNGTKWNETGDLKVPTDDKVLFTVANTNDWNGATTTWSTMSTYPTYTITLDRQSGTTGDQSVTATYGSAAPSITKPTRTNYTFEGYYTQANGQGDLYIDKNGAWQDIAGIVDGKWMKPACNLTLYAKWKKNTYKVTITATNGGSVDKDGEKEVGGEGLQVTASPSDGYSFSYWEVTGDVSVADSKSATTIITATGTGTVTAHFEITLYLETNEHWREHSADFAVYAFIDEHANEWFNLTQIDCSKYYKVTIPAKYSNVIFCRMNPNRNNKENNWNDGVMWTKTQDMSISDVKNVCFQITNDHWGENNAITEGQWIAYPGTYTITLNQTNGGTITTSPASPVAPNTKVTVTMNPNPGYSFESGKITIGTGAEQDINATSTTHTICGNTTISAEWTAITSTITWEANGGSVEPTSSKYTYNGAIIGLPTPNREGYKFNGWFTESTGGTKITEIGTNHKPTSDVTYYAQWEANKYRVIFNNNGGQGEMAAQYFTYGVEQVLIKNTFKKSGYFFAGWNTAADGSGTPYNDNTKVNNLTTAEEITLYAQWTAITISATLTPEEGTIGANNLTFSITSNVPTNSGYMVGVYNFGESEYAGGELSGVTSYNNNPQTHTGTPNFVKAGTFYTRAFIMLNSEIQATSDKIAFIVKDGAITPDPEDLTWKMYDKTTELGIFTKQDENTYTLTIDVPENCNWLINYKYDQQYYTGAESLLQERTLVVGNGQVPWQDGAGKFTITIRKEGEVWKISAVKVVGAIDITSCPEYLTTSQSLELGYRFDGIPSTWKYQVCSRNTTKSVDACYNQLTDMPISSPSTFTSTEGLSEGVHEVVIKVYDGEQLMLKSKPKIVTVEAVKQIDIFTIVDGESTALGQTISPTEHIGVEVTAAEKAGYLFTGWTSQILQSGTITFSDASAATTTVTATADGRIYANYVNNQPQPTGLTLEVFNDWDQSADKEFKLLPTNPLPVLVVTLQANHTYRFKVKYKDNTGEIYMVNSNSKEFLTKDNKSVQLRSDGSDNGDCQITTTQAGDYVFTWEEQVVQNQRKVGILHVEYPNNCTVTFFGDGGKVTAVSGDKSLTSPAKVNIGSNITFTATPNTNNQFEKWVDENGNLLSTNPTYTIQDIQNDLTVEAVFIKPTPVYLKPSSVWLRDNARFAIYYWKDEQDNGWANMRLVGCNGEYYVADLPIGYTNFKFVRLNPSTKENAFKKDVRWNETGDLKLPADGRNLFDMTWIYLNATSIWDKDYARFAAYFIRDINNTTDGRWMSMESTGTQHVYKCLIPGDAFYDWLSFCRMNGENTTNDWNNKWNQTNDLKMPGSDNDSYKTFGNYYTITDMGGDKSSGEWSWNDIAWSRLELPSITYDTPQNGTMTVKTVSGKTIKTGDKVAWDTDVIITLTPDAGYKVKTANISMGGETQQIVSGQRYNICGNTTIYVEYEIKEEYYLIGLDGDWSNYKEKYLFVDGKAVVELDGPGTKQFKIAKVRGTNLETRYGNVKNFSITKTSATLAIDQNSENDHCEVKTLHYGEYEFTWNPDTRVLDIRFPIMQNDYRLAYQDATTGSFHPERVIKQRTTGERLDTVSFFVDHDNSPKLVLQQCNEVKSTTGAVTWTTLNNITFNVASTGVWNFVLQQTNNGTNTAQVLTGDNIKPYTGDYYIRTASAENGWMYFRQDSHKMTYSSYADEHEPFSHYFCKWVSTDAVAANYTKNVKYTIANDYGDCISDTLAADPENANPRIVTDADGDLPTEGANVRFGWDWNTNEIRRAYMAGATNATAATFLRIEQAENLKNSDGAAVTEINFADLQNWIYQVDVKANKESQIKLTALYANHLQYFKGGAGDGENDKISLLSSEAKDMEFNIRLTYDFKTNHLIIAWLPDNQEAGGKLEANMMIIRKHNRDNVQVTQLNLNSELTNVKTVYGVITFAKDWIQKSPVTREQSIYWVSFPFNVKVSEIFGFGEYMDAWILQYYDGAERARKGLFADSGTYWKYIMDPNTTLQAGVGYVLVLDLNKVKFNHDVNSVSLYFPSVGEVGTITREISTTVTVPEHKCEITTGTIDHTITDSHWNLIGVPAFKDVNEFSTDKTLAPVYHQDSVSFYYEFLPNKSTYRANNNVTDFKAMYSYMVQFAGTINWNTKQAITPAQLAARRNGESELPEKVVLGLELVQGEEKADQTFVQLQQEGATNDFDMNIDLTKIINSGANIYTLTNDRIQAAGNALPMEEAIVPVGIQIAAEGEYTFRMPDGTEGMVVELVDYETNTRTNLLLSDYITTLPKGTSENRFALHIQPQKDVVTSLENIGEGVNNGEAVNKYLIDGKLIIRTAEGVFDAQGKRL